MSTPPHNIDALIETAERLGREDLIGMMRSVPCPFPLDFTDEYLATMPLERLKHLVVVVYLYSWKTSPGGGPLGPVKSDSGSSISAA